MSSYVCSIFNNKVLYLKWWCNGVRFAVVHRQLRVRDPQKCSIFKVSS